MLTYGEIISNVVLAISVARLVLDIIKANHDIKRK